MKKVIKGAMILIIVFAVLYFGTGQHISDDTPDCEQMALLPAGVDRPYAKLDFSQKTRLTSNKLGFRKKLVISEESVVCQQVDGFPDTEAYYGIYKDEELKEPVEEVNFNWLHRDGAFEEGKVDTPPPYDETKDGIVILAPGTYYAGVYTRSFFESFEASYLSYVCPLNENCRLTENKEVIFYVVKDGQKNTFEICADQDGTVKIKANIFFAGTLRVYDESGKLLTKKEARTGDDNWDTVTFDVKEGDSYFAEVENCEVSRDVDIMYDYKIKYRYI